MFVIVGWLVCLGCVFGVFIIHCGNISVILKALPWEMLTIGGATVGALLVAGSCRAPDSCVQPPARWSRPQKVRAARVVLRHGVSPAEWRAVTNRSTWST